MNLGPSVPNLVSLFLTGALCLWTLQTNATIDSSLQMQLGNPSGAMANTNNHNNYLLVRSVEAIDYNDNRGLPNWVSWDLTHEDVGDATRSDYYFTDTSLPPNFYRVKDSDYIGVSAINFNRGHLCPSEDRTDTDTHNDMVFRMSNIIPQSAHNNNGVWSDLEDYCRDLATTNELLLIAGPSDFGTNKIPSGKVYIPSNVWKIIVIVPPGNGTALSRITTTNRVISVSIPNATNGLSNAWQNYVTSAHQIELKTGLDFFTALPGVIASAFRARIDGLNSPPPTIISFSPTSGNANTSVLITGTNFDSTSLVRFNGSNTIFRVDSNRQIMTLVPTNSTSGTISVTAPGGIAISTTIFNVNMDTNGGILAGWDTSSLTNYGFSPLSPSYNAIGLTVTGLTRGAGVYLNGAAPNRAWGGVGFTNQTSINAIASNQFATFSVAPKNGYTVSFKRISRFDYRRSSTGATNGLVQYRLNAGAFINITNIVYTSASSSGASIAPINLSGIAPLQNVGYGTNVTFRIVNWGGTSSVGRWCIYDVANSTAPDLALQGFIAPK